MHGPPRSPPTRRNRKGDSRKIEPHCVPAQLTLLVDHRAEQVRIGEIEFAGDPDGGLAGAQDGADLEMVLGRAGGNRGEVTRSRSTRRSACCHGGLQVVRVLEGDHCLADTFSVERDARPRAGPAGAAASNSGHNTHIRLGAVTALIFASGAMKSTYLLTCVALARVVMLGAERRFWDLVRTLCGLTKINNGASSTSIWDRLLDLSAGELDQVTGSGR